MILRDTAGSLTVTELPCIDVPIDGFGIKARDTTERPAPIANVATKVPNIIHRKVVILIMDAFIDYQNKVTN
jgi:hypothetical protein